MIHLIFLLLQLLISPFIHFHPLCITGSKTKLLFGYLLLISCTPVTRPFFQKSWGLAHCTTHNPRMTSETCFSYFSVIFVHGPSTNYRRVCNWFPLQLVPYSSWVVQYVKVSMGAWKWKIQFKPADKYYMLHEATNSSYLQVFLNRIH